LNLISIDFDDLDDHLSSYRDVAVSMENVDNVVVIMEVEELIHD
jgi:hypothetical protein